jgi:metal-responsive CopG/Arc/MetJ family transcriptional regulator
MKTTISIPDRLFEEAESLAAQRGMSRSELYSQALARFVASQKTLGVRERLDSVYGGSPADSELEPAMATLQSQSLVCRW